LSSKKKLPSPTIVRSIVVSGAKICCQSMTLLSSSR